MPHIHKKSGQHDHTTSAWIIRTDCDVPRLLLHKHKKLGVYMQFGGHIELDETPWQAIIHEIAEESGYGLSQLKILQPSGAISEIGSDQAVLHPQPVCLNTHPIGKNHFHSDISWAFTTNEGPKHSIGVGESLDIKALSRTEIMSLEDNEIYSNVRSIARYIFDTCLVSWELVEASKFKH